MSLYKRINKRRTFLAISAIVILIGALYFVVNQVTKADLQENLNSQIKLSQISISGDTDGASPIGTIELTVPRGESKSFAVLANNESSASYPDFSIEKTNLTNASGQVIPSSAIDERVVHNWVQKLIDFTVAPNGEISREVDELLVRNEKPALGLPTDPKYKNDPFFSNDITKERQDLLKSTGSTQQESLTGTEKIKTSLGSSSQKKFFFTVTLPQNSQGDYSSVINFVDRANQSVVAKFNIKVKAAQYSLEQTHTNDLRMGCYTNDQVLSDHSNLDMFKKRMQIVHEHGCEQLVFRVNQNVDNVAGLEILSEIGFKGPIILNFASVKNTGELNLWTYLNTQEEKNQFSQILTSIKNSSKITTPMLFYGTDEPNSKTPVDGQPISRFDMQKRKTENIKAIVSSIYGSSMPSNIINQVTTSATSETFSELFQQDIYKTDYPIVNFKDVYSLLGQINSGSYQPQKYETFYFQGYYEIEKQFGLFNNNRFLAGLGVLNTGLSGSMLNPTIGYSSTVIRPIYDDLLLTAEMFNGKAWHKQMLTFYPASDGMIPTLQSEGWREGNMDLRYYLTFDKIKNNTQNFSESKKAMLADLKTQIELRKDKYRIAQDAPARGIAEDVDDLEMDQTRELLEAYLNTYYSDLDSSQSSLIESFNLKDGDKINTSPYVIRVKPYDSSQILRADFYVNNDKIASTDALDGNGYYSYGWDARTEKLETVLVKAILIAKNGELEEASAQVYLELGSVPIVASPSTTSEAVSPTVSAISDAISPTIEGVENLSSNTVLNYDPRLNPRPIYVAARVTDNVEVKTVEFWLDGKLVATPTHPDIDHIYEANLGVLSLGQHRIDVVAYDLSGNKAQGAFGIDYEVINYQTGTVNSNGNQTVTTPADPTEENLDSEQVSSAQQSPVAGEEIVDILPKTGSQSLIQMLKFIITFQWTR